MIYDVLFIPFVYLFCSPYVLAELVCANKCTWNNECHYARLQKTHMTTLSVFNYKAQNSRSHLNKRRTIAACMLVWLWPDDLVIRTYKPFSWKLYMHTKMMSSTAHWKTDGNDAVVVAHFWQTLQKCNSVRQQNVEMEIESLFVCYLCACCEQVLFCRRLCVCPRKISKTTDQKLM